MAEKRNFGLEESPSGLYSSEELISTFLRRDAAVLRNSNDELAKSQLQQDAKLYGMEVVFDSFSSSQIEDR